MQYDEEVIAGSVSVGEDIDYGKRRDFIRHPERLQQRYNVPADKVFQTNLKYTVPHELCNDSQFTTNNMCEWNMKMRVIR